MSGVARQDGTANVLGGKKLSLLAVQQRRSVELLDSKLWRQTRCPRR
jgi:hypothetical protein